jgi:hypothetical protein
MQCPDGQSFLASGSWSILSSGITYISIHQHILNNWTSLQCGSASAMASGESVGEEDDNYRTTMAVGELGVEEDGNDRPAMAAGEQGGYV